ncbi:MAG: hypothetical protein GTO18_08190 [Anaerolineales bacterium]|nr:hypothetical protein [Anaerolineales bacterium]
MQKEKILGFPYHILFLAVFPALALLVNNLGQTALWVIHRPLIVSILIAVLVYFGTWLLVRNTQKASLIAAWTLVLFFSYGHVYQLVEDYELFGILIGRHRYLVTLWGVLFFVGTWLILWKIQASMEVTRVVNLMSLILVVFQISQIAVYQIRRRISHQQAQATLSDPVLTPGDPGAMPDIYLIILDMYGREDALREHYRYDNSDFLTGLEELGFYVADCAQSNYTSTFYSLASELNLAYLEDLMEEVDFESTSYLHKNSMVRLALEEIGYTVVDFETVRGATNEDESNGYDDLPQSDQIILKVEPFEFMFIEGTLGRPLLDYYVSQHYVEYQLVWTPIEIKAQRVQFQLDRLRLLPAMEGPKFVHAHIMVPHPPHVFNSDGSVNLQAEQMDDKIGLPIQLNYLNPRVLEIVERIIRTSNPDPIVILQGDHGLQEFQRNSILFAIYLPDGVVEELYPQFSLVNTFRIVFNEYFGTNYPLLPDSTVMNLKIDRFDIVPSEEWNPACIP